MKKIQIILIILIIIWMTVIFCFSAQDADDSSKTSGRTLKVIVDTLPETKDLKETEKEEIIEDWQPTIRKLAHYSIYTIGGVLLYAFFNTTECINAKKVIYTILSGACYAITDEFHQYFVDGRSSEIRDVCIDTAGIITGMIIMIFITKLMERMARKKHDI